MLKDGHIHTAYCPHGSKDTLIQYIERGIELGYKEMTFTEHAPLPPTFSDPAGDSAMEMAKIDNYFTDLQIVKDSYKNNIKINIGLEVDFIEGFEQETTKLLNEWGPVLDDAILSVHFLKAGEEYICMDLSPEAFQELINKKGSLQSVYSLYYDTVELSIESDLGTFKPERIGHISLVHKFQKLFPRTFNDEQRLIEIVKKMKSHGYALDVNGAGLTKPHCKEIYPPLPIVKKAHEMGVPLVYGSDAHNVAGLGQGINDFLSLNA